MVRTTTVNEEQVSGIGLLPISENIGDQRETITDFFVYYYFTRHGGCLKLRSVLGNDYKFLTKKSFNTVEIKVFVQSRVIQ